MEQDPKSLVPGSESGNNQNAQIHPKNDGGHNHNHQPTWTIGDVIRKAMPAIRVFSFMAIVECLGLFLEHVSDVFHGVFIEISNWISLCLQLLAVAVPVAIWVEIRWKKKKWVWIPYGIVCLVMLLAMFVPTSQPTKSAELKPATTDTSGWLPPELPPGCSNVVISFGPGMASITKSDAELFGKLHLHEPVPFKQFPKDIADLTEKILPKDWINNPNLHIGASEFKMNYVTGEYVDSAIIPYVISNRLFVSVKIPFQNSQQEISMSDAMDSKLPPFWDWNWSSNAFEVVNERNLPVLQVWYDHANQIEVSGVFVLNTNYLMATFGRRKPLEIAHGNIEVVSQFARIDPPFQAVVTETQTFTSFENFNKAYPNKAVGAWIDEKGIYNMVFSGQMPIFKYPSFQHRGVFADAAPTNAPWENERLVFPTNSQWDFTGSWKQ